MVHWKSMLRVLPSMLNCDVLLWLWSDSVLKRGLLQQAQSSHLCQNNQLCEFESKSECSRNLIL